MNKECWFVIIEMVASTPPTFKHMIQAKEYTKEMQTIAKELSCVDTAVILLWRKPLSL